MKKQIAAVVLAVSVAGGVGSGVLANALTTKEPAAATAPEPTTTAPTSVATPETVDALELAPGSVGLVKVGMSKKDALATGMFDGDVASATDGCPVLPLMWKKAYTKALDVLTLGNGEITSIGVRGKQPRTAAGLGVGSTYAQVRAQVDEPTPIDAGYGQSGLFEYDGDNGGWIGYLFNPPADQLKDTDTVSFVEVTKGEQPSLMRDGC
jgi:hypothetical protein